MLTFEPLRKILKERGISSYYLRYKCGSNKIDQKTLKRLLTDKSVSTNTLTAGDFFGEARGEQSFPGPFTSIENKKVYSIDPRKKIY